jgi:tetratricopeptide (TPR) repeat protein
LVVASDCKRLAAPIRERRRTGYPVAEAAAEKRLDQGISEFASQTESLLALVIALSAVGAARAADDRSILTYHGAPNRSGKLHRACAHRRAGVRHAFRQWIPSQAFRPLYAQPLYWREAGADAGVLFAATESNEVQALDAATGAHLWADRYDRDLTDIFEVQDEVVEKIVGALAVTLTKGEQQRLRRHGTSNVEAYECWLRARALLTRGTRESIVEARAMYRRAIEFDQNFAAPHAGLAFAAIADHTSGWALDSAQALLEAERWARRALELNDQEPVSHMALGNVLLWRRDHEGALAEFARMIALDPNFAQGHTATGLALMYAGEPARALEPFATAMRLDPHYPDIVLHFLAQANFSLGKYEIAAQQLLDRIARNPSTDASRMLLASCYGYLGRAEEARAVWAELLKVNPDFSLMQRARVLPYRNPDDFQRILEGLAKAGLP